jgi:pimeloyl-ACP methyl ester carboxylesterase
MKKFVIAFLLLAPVIASSQVAGLGKDFVSKIIAVNGTKIHYVRGGSGPAVILIHGYPMDWYSYRKVMPMLAKKFTVIAVDLRGVGGSTPTKGGYESTNLATDIYQLTQQLKLEKVYVVGHDIGAMVAYAYARLFPTSTRGAMMLDVPLPGIEPWDEVAGCLWHIGFHQTPGLAEKLVAGRQALYFRQDMKPNIFSDAELAHYAAAYKEPDHLRAGFELYRAFPANGKFFDEQRSELDVPLVWAAGDTSFFSKIGEPLGASLKAHGCKRVQIEQIANCGHWVAMEQPEGLVKLIEKHAVQ